MSSDYIEKYEYDNKKSPFTHCNTPKWWMQAYEYDDAGYPIKCEDVVCKYFSPGK